MSVLLLDVSFSPVRVIPTRRAVTLLLAGKADLIEVDPEGRPIRSASLEMPRPAVIRLTGAARAPFRRVQLTRRMLSWRDGGVCQVSGCDRAGRTIDHVVPRSRGGAHCWTNVVLMCEPHNHRKSDRLLAELGWELKRQPFEPRRAVLLTDSQVPEAWSAWLPQPVG